MDEVTEQSDDGPREEGTAMEGKRIVRDIHDRVEAEENEEEAEEEEEEGHEDEDEGESDKIGVWDSQARLSAETTALVLMAAYERCIDGVGVMRALVCRRVRVRVIRACVRVRARGHYRLLIFGLSSSGMCSRLRRCIRW